MLNFRGVSGLYRYNQGIDICYLPPFTRTRLIFIDLGSVCFFRCFFPNPCASKEMGNYVFIRSTPQNSHQQDCYIFSRESLQHFICRCYWVGGRSNVFIYGSIRESRKDTAKKSNFSIPVKSWCVFFWMWRSWKISPEKGFLCLFLFFPTSSEEAFRPGKLIFWTQKIGGL